MAAVYGIANNHASTQRLLLARVFFILVWAQCPVVADSKAALTVEPGTHLPTPQQEDIVWTNPAQTARQSNDGSVPRMKHSVSTVSRGRRYIASSSSGQNLQEQPARSGNDDVSRGRRFSTRRRRRAVLRSHPFSEDAVARLHRFSNQRIQRSAILGGQRAENANIGSSRGLPSSLFTNAAMLPDATPEDSWRSAKHQNISNMDSFIVEASPPSLSPARGSIDGNESMFFVQQFYRSDSMRFSQNRRQLHGARVDNSAMHVPAAERVRAILPESLPAIAKVGVVRSFNSSASVSQQLSLVSEEVVSQKSSSHPKARIVKARPEITASRPRRARSTQNRSSTWLPLALADRASAALHGEGGVSPLVILLFGVVAMVLVVLVVYVSATNHGEDSRVPSRGPSSERGARGERLSSVERKSINGGRGAAAPLGSPQQARERQQQENVKDRGGVPPIPRAEVPDSAASLQMEHLCPSLVVPSGMEFVFAVKEVVTTARQQTAFGIVDVKGQTLKHVIIAEIPSPGARFVPKCGIHIQTLTGAPLCSVLTSSVHERSGHFPEICRPNGEVFCQVVRDGPVNLGRYTLIHKTGQRLLTFHGDFREKATNVVNTSGRLVCATERCIIDFDSAPYYQVRVAPHVDAGLVLCGLLAIDKMEGSGGADAHHTSNLAHPTNPSSDQLLTPITGSAAWDSLAPDSSGSYVSGAEGNRSLGGRPSPLLR